MCCCLKVLIIPAEIWVTQRPNPRNATIIALRFVGGVVNRRVISLPQIMFEREIFLSLVVLSFDSVCSEGKYQCHCRDDCSKNHRNEGPSHACERTPSKPVPEPHPKPPP